MDTGSLKVDFSGNNHEFEGLETVVLEIRDETDKLLARLSVSGFVHEINVNLDSFPTKIKTAKDMVKFLCDIGALSGPVDYI